MITWHFQNIVSDSEMKSQKLLTITSSQNLRPVRSAESLVKESQKASQPATNQSSSKVSDRLKADPNSRPMSQDLDELAPLEIVQRAVGASQMARNSPKGHNRSSSHDSYFERKLSSLFGGSSELPTPDANIASNPDLSEIQMNFELEEKRNENIFWGRKCQLELQKFRNRSPRQDTSLRNSKLGFLSKIQKDQPQGEAKAIHFSHTC